MLPTQVRDKFAFKSYDSMYIPYEYPADIYMQLF